MKLADMPWVGQIALMRIPYLPISQAAQMRTSELIPPLAAPY
jgi:hypothetical protein